MIKSARTEATLSGEKKRREKSAKKVIGANPEFTVEGGVRKQEV